MNKRLCMVVHQDYSTDSRVKAYVGSLTRRGWHVDVLSLRGKGQTFREHVDGVNVYTLPLGKGYRALPLYFVEYALAMMGFSALLGVLWAKRRYSVIHVHNMPDFLAFSALVPRLFGSRVILDVHDPMPEFFSSKYRVEMGSLPVRLLRFEERLSAGFADSVIAANSSFRDNLVDRGVPAEKITVVNNVPDPRVFERRSKPGSERPFTLIYPGTIAPRYGLDVAVRALPLMVGRIPDVRLRIVGPRVEHGEELRQLAEELGVRDHLAVEPPVPVERVPELMREADLGIYPALPDPHMSIATPTKVLEYASMGLPVVASRLPVLERLFGDEAISYFEPGDAEALAERVHDLWSSNEERTALVARMDHVFRERFSIEREQQRYVDLVDRLASGVSGRSTERERSDVSRDS